MTAFSCLDLQTDTAYLHRKQLQKFLSYHSFVLSDLFPFYIFRCVGILGLLFLSYLEIFFIKFQVFILTPYLFSSFCMFDVLAILTFYARSFIFIWTCSIKLNFITLESMPAKGYLLLPYLYLWV